MTDTGQPTVDRLGALEAALRKIASLDKHSGASLRARAASEIARAALDAASPLTTPTPDKGALERAREAIEAAIRHACVDPDSDEAQFRVLEPFLETNIAAALTAAEGAWRSSVNTRPLFCKKYGFRMVENCGECIQPDPCYRIDCFLRCPHNRRRSNGPRM